MSGDDGEILGNAAGAVWERNRNDCSILSETQSHELRAAVAQPEVFHSALAASIRVGGRGQFAVGFQPKQSSFLEIAERCATGRRGSPPYRTHHPFYAYILLRGGRGSSAPRYASV